MRYIKIFIAAIIALTLTACSDTSTAEVTTTSVETTETVSETDTLSAESEETTAETAVEDLKTDKSDELAEDEVDIEPIEDETFLDMTTETEETFPAHPIPPELAEEHVYGGRSNIFLNDDFIEDFEHVLWMPLTKTFVSDDNCELLYFESDEKLAYVGVEKATGENTTLDFLRKYDESFADDPMAGVDYLNYVNHLSAVSGDDALQYFPADTAIPSTIVLFPDCADFYYYGAATKEEYENSEYHWTKSKDLGLIWRPNGDSATVGNFYFEGKPVYYEHGVWICDNKEIWIG